MSSAHASAAPDAAATPQAPTIRLASVTPVSHLTLAVDSEPAFHGVSSALLAEATTRDAVESAFAAIRAGDIATGELRLSRLADAARELARRGDIALSERAALYAELRRAADENEQAAKLVMSLRAP